MESAAINEKTKEIVDAEFEPVIGREKAKKLETLLDFRNRVESETERLNKLLYTWSRLVDTVPEHGKFLKQFYLNNFNNF